MTAKQIAANLRERAVNLRLEAQAMGFVADVLDPPAPKRGRKPRTPAPAKSESAKTPRRRRAKAGATMHATTGIGNGPSESEMRDREVAHVTSEGMR